ncbi:MAG TPA: hypothetical protein VJ722_09215, partial [Rhodanobacteraceae bacterium]|nr:hypothetical protein [Rhodanobacteraceae bacterium]
MVPQHPLQGLDIAIATNQRIRAFRHPRTRGRCKTQGRRSFRRDGFDRGDETIAEAMHGLDAAGISAVIGQRPAQLRD